MQTIIKSTTVSLLSHCFASFIGNRLSWDPEMSGIGTGLLVLKAAYFNFSHLLAIIWEIFCLILNRLLY